VFFEMILIDPIKPNKIYVKQTIPINKVITALETRFDCTCWRVE